MRRLFLISLLISLIFQIQVVSANAEKTFWKESFNSPDFPEGWKLVALNDSSSTWFLTDQPFPGSTGRNYQAPPISSKSRGFHMQYAPGTLVGSNLKSWQSKAIFPSSYVETKAIDCSRKNSVVLKFQQNFFWGKLRPKNPNSGLVVAVSNNGKDWKEYDVRYNIASKEDCPNPMNVELNITKTAARQKTVYLRFWWRELYQWYWMIDDIELSEAFDADFEALNLTSHAKENNIFRKNDTLVYKVVNLSSKPLLQNATACLQVDNRPVQRVIIKADKLNPIGIIDTVLVKFPNVDLSDIGVHKVKFYTELVGDQRLTNDTLSSELYSKASSLGKITSFSANDNQYLISCSSEKLKIQVLRDDVFRIWMSYDGNFTNPAGNDLIVQTPSVKVNSSFKDKGSYYLIQTPEMSIRAYKDPIRFALYKADDKTMIWEEAKGMTYGRETVQYLKRGPEEQFFGGGMQNGRFSHRDKTIKMTIDYNWEDGGNPNPATFYMSNSGYGAVRNTYAIGNYEFKDTVRTSHKESRFDCYYMIGNSLKEILGNYTDLTGKPFLMPRWALSMGDANCYNRGAKSGKTIGTTTTGHQGLTPSVINLIADKYVEHNMPRGWILPNDGYGCGCTALDSVVKELKTRGFYTGLWTENGVDKMAVDVGQAGSRLAKLDVAWVGPGFKFAMDGAKQAYEGIENNSDARGFVWTVCGWTGSHRNSVVWTGDQSGNWNYIRWHIPTLIGSGLSAQNCATGDIDGIFGGSDSTYVRDLQWKCFTPVLLSMSGWAYNNKNGIKDKQPWLFGEPYTSINRKYLQLKQRFTPYMYTLCNEAYETGVPAVRALVLEYPDDPVSYGQEVKYEYLLGKNLLVAPVFKSEDKRDSIYLPEGDWIDYWDGTVFQGKTTLMNYHAPLDKLPLFVKAGSILPMYQEMKYDWERPTDSLTLKVYPKGTTAFEMYEDDGLTRKHREGEFAKTRFEVMESDLGFTDITIHPAQGDFQGRLKERVYLMDVFSTEIPKKIQMNGVNLKHLKNESDFKGKNSGWYFEKGNKSGIIHVKSESISTDKKAVVKIIQ